MKKLSRISSAVERQVHTLEADGAIPSSATNHPKAEKQLARFGGLFLGLLISM